MLGHADIIPHDSASLIYIMLFGAGPLIPPDVLKRLRAHCRVPNGVGDAGVAEVVLQPSGVHTLPCQRVRSLCVWRFVSQAPSQHGDAAAFFQQGVLVIDFAKP